MHTRPVWVEISRRDLVANYLELRGAAGSRGNDIEILAVVKANAYGHGMRDCAQILAKTGAEWLGVTSVEEGVNARAACPDARILVMSGVWHGEADAAIEHELTPIVWEPFHLELLEAAAKRQSLAPQSLAVHLELDTGMSRQGVSLHGPAFEDVLMRFSSGSALRLDGIATHFSAPEALDSGETNRQRLQLERALARVASHRLSPRWVHAGNSTTILHGEQLMPLQQAAARMGARLMLRPGLSLYGYAPRFTGAGHAVTQADCLSAKLRPVLAWKTRIASLRTIEAGESAGYNSTFRATRLTRLALLPVGYADGFSRLLSSRGSVLVRGRRAPIAGRISMDQTVVDVTDISAVEIGDEVVLIGNQCE